MAYYERLSALDASFLGIEDDSLHMHVGGVLMFEAEPLRNEHGGLDIDRIRLAVASRLHLVPRFRQKIAYIPWEGAPVWVDDERFRLAYHVRHTALPRPGSDRILKRLVGRIMSQALDRKRPLWEMWVAEGLEGDRFALISKVHHCMIDGVSGADLMSVILSPFQNEEVQAPEPWTPRPRPTRSHLFADALARRIEQPRDVVRSLYETINDRERLEELAERAKGVLETLAPALSPTSSTPINVDVGPHRRFDWTSMRVADLKAVKNILGGTLNDVVLATVSGALRRFFTKRGESLEDLSVRALCPVSVRSQDERGALGNRVSQLTVPLPIDVDDPVKRMEAVWQTTAGLKESKQALGGEVLTAISEWTVPNVLVQAVRLAARTRPYNLVVTNVPGPQIPLYVSGARMTASFPVVPLFSEMGLSIGLFSYDGGLHWGLNADWEHLPDLHDLVVAIDSSFHELQRAAEEVASGQRRAPAQHPDAKKRKPRRAEAGTQ